MQTMKYEEARPLIQTLDVLAWSGNSLFSKLIKWWTKSPYSHVGMANAAHERIFVLESIEGRGVVDDSPLHARTPFYWLPNVLFKHVIKLLTNPAFINSEENRNFCHQKFQEKGLIEAIKHKGEGYSIGGCVRGGLNIITRKNDRRWQCAEYVNHVLATIGLDLAANAETPVDVVNEIYKLNGGKIIYVTE